MLIDTISVIYSDAVANTTVTNPSQDRFIHGWADLLKSVGWSQISAIQATATVIFPLGAPITQGVTILPKTPVGCTAPPGSFSIGDTTFNFYDPFTEVPNTNLTCFMVPMDTTFAGSLDNLVSAINFATPWFAFTTQNSPVNFTMTLTALGGPDFNFVYMRSSGLTTGEVRSAGGGYELESKSGTDSAVYRCTVTNADPGGAGVNYLAGNIMFTFRINGQLLSYQILDSTQGTVGFMGELGVGGVAAYTIIANGFGFAVFDMPSSVSTHIYRAVSVFAMAPFFPTSESVPESEDFIPAYAVFTVGPNQVGGPPMWNNALMAPSIMCLDAQPFTTNGFNPSARLLAYRSPQYPLLTPDGVPLNIGAYVQFGSATGNTSPAWVVGKLWDCAICSDIIDSGAIIDDRQFLTLGTSDGTNHLTKCTVLMACGTAIVPDPPAPAPPPPPPPMSGTVNLFGDGVTWASGDVFSVAMEGHSMTIAGTSYIVLSVADSTHLTLTTAKTIASGAAYTTP